MDLEPRISASDLTTRSSIYTEKAWHLVAILLFIGRPATPPELAARCNLFGTSPEFVQFLCFMPNSPLFLTESGFVTLSLVAMVAVGEIVSTSMPRVEIGGSQVRRLIRGDVVRTYFRKRKRNDVMAAVKRRAVLLPLNENEGGKSIYSSSEFVQSTSLQVHGIESDNISSAMDLRQFDSSIRTFSLENFMDVMGVSSLYPNSCPQLLKCHSEDDEITQAEKKQNAPSIYDLDENAVLQGYQSTFHNCNRTSLKIHDFHEKDIMAPILALRAESPVMLGESRPNSTNLMSGKNNVAPCTGADWWTKAMLVDIADSVHTYAAFSNPTVVETRMEDVAEHPSDCSSTQENIENFGCSSSFAPRDAPIQDSLHQANQKNSSDAVPASRRKLEEIQAQGITGVPSYDQSVAQGSSKKLAVTMEDAQIPKQKVSSRSAQQNKGEIVLKERNKSQKDRNSIFLKQKPKPISKNNCFIKENDENFQGNFTKNHESKEFPKFESYIVEEEEGSGGYGTVYRARRKSDGIKFAIKCPHANAPKQHVKNELRMLERFGGRNFVIKYEGSSKSGNSECFVLEHVEHDRPEVLKREIDVHQLQWYGYCMFKALASLHKQGAFHRDVKPGNFLFSRNSSKGYLIDFNLTKDLHLKQANIDKSKATRAMPFQHVSNTQPKSISPSKHRKIPSGKSHQALNDATAISTKPALAAKIMKKKAVDKIKIYDNIGHRNSFTSQGAEGSGLTSTKDITSNRTPSGERFREPLPCHGRKELLNLAQEAMHSPNHRVPTAPASNRKRVAASPGMIDSKLSYITPMPLHSSGIAVPGAGLLKSRGEVKSQKEGPCVGTKGFRAPEVLLRSAHQGPKVDVWSAGVTLLYLITGRLPFTGEPEQNMKDIVKLRGSEELWEVARLHNRDSSFPVDLFDIRFLPSMKLQDWCATHTKRPDFLEVLPASLLDLIDKCLTVNPRSRLSAEEALKHEFFAPCHEARQRQRFLQRSISIGSYHDNSATQPGNNKTLRVP